MRQDDTQLGEPRISQQYRLDHTFSAPVMALT